MTRPSLVSALTYLIPLAIASTSCGKKNTDQTQLKNVFGVDNREDILTTDYPWSTVGRLENGCTGTLIGRRLVLTAAHCVYDSKLQSIQQSLQSFRPNLVRGLSPSTTYIDYFWYGSQNPEENRGQDWAILRLSERVGDAQKWMPVASVDIAASLPMTTNLVGYSYDRDQGNTATIHRDCYIHAVNGERLLHDCDSTSGISGAPLLSMVGDRLSIIGITVSEYRQGADNSVHRDHYSAEYANVGISATNFAEVVNQLRLTVDGDMAPPQFPGVFSAPNPNAPNVGGNPIPNPSGNPPQVDPPLMASYNISKVIDNAYEIMSHLETISHKCDEVANIYYRFPDVMNDALSLGKEALTYKEMVRQTRLLSLPRARDRVPNLYETHLRILRRVNLLEDSVDQVDLDPMHTSCVPCRDIYAKANRIRELIFDQRS